MLGEITVITGDRIAGMRVRIPKPVDMPEKPFDNPNISISGAGRVVGVVLVEESTPLRKAYQFVSTRWDFCGARGCSGDWQTSLTHGMNWRGRHGYRIPAGDYRLYLIADGADARVELRLDGLSGTVSLEPRGRVAGRIASPTSTVPTPSPYTFFGRGKRMHMPTYGLLIDGDAVEHGPGAHTEGSCYWRVEEGDEEDLRHSTPGPHCRSFAERGGAGAGFATFGGGSRSWGTGTVPAGDWESSYWSTVVSPAARSDFLALWLAYENPDRG